MEGAPGAAPPQPPLMEDGGRSYPGGPAKPLPPPRSRLVTHSLICAPAPSGVPGGPLCLRRTRVYRSLDGSPEGRAQDRLGQPCVSTGRRDESAASPGWTRVSLQGGRAPRGSKGKEDQRRSRPRGLAEGPALSLSSVPVPSSTAWAAVELSPATTSLRSIAFSPPHVGSLFFILFFLAPWDIKLASCFFGLPLPPFG